MRKVWQIVLATNLASAMTLPEQSPDTMHIPLSSGREIRPRSLEAEANTNAFFVALNDVLAKYNSTARVPSGVLGNQKRGIDVAGSGASPSNLKLIDQVDGGTDLTYYGECDISGQTFKLIFDTGSCNLFIPGPSCTLTNGCSGNVKYDGSGTDQNSQTSVTYGSGAVSGENYKDIVTCAGFQAIGQDLIVLSNAQGFTSIESDGLMGMGFPSICNGGQNGYFFNLIKQRTDCTQEFSFYLGRQLSGTMAASQMTLCGRDQSKYSGPVTQVPITVKGYWQVALDCLVVDGSPAFFFPFFTQGQAAIDTGTTIILAPTVAATALFLTIPGSFPIPFLSGSPTLTIFGYPCQTPKQMGIRFGGTNFAINPLDFNFGQMTESIVDRIFQALHLDVPDTIKQIFEQYTPLGGICLAAVAGTDLDPTQNLYVVGDSFLKNWYSIYNVQDSYVGFAKAIGNQ